MAGSQGSSGGQPRRVLVVEDEILIGMLLEDMLGDLGYEVAATASRVDEAVKLAHEVSVDAAILDVNLNGQDVYPVAEVLAARGIPFVFATGYGERGLPQAYHERPTLPKPFQQETLGRKLAGLFHS
ncbi:MAG TPA: response regulator [Xanthobacteraceae bacterium]|nr:response regulator [Xanthobacteraceae bacterium]